MIANFVEFRRILRPGSRALFDITLILYIDMAAQSLLELSLLKKWGLGQLLPGLKPQKYLMNN